VLTLSWEKKDRAEALPVTTKGVHGLLPTILFSHFYKWYVFEDADFL